MPPRSPFAAYRVLLRVDPPTNTRRKNMRQPPMPRSPRKRPQSAKSLPPHKSLSPHSGHLMQQLPATSKPTGHLPQPLRPRCDTSRGRARRAGLSVRAPERKVQKPKNQKVQKPKSPKTQKSKSPICPAPRIYKIRVRPLEYEFSRADPLVGGHLLGSVLAPNGHSTDHSNGQLYTPAWMSAGHRHV